MIETIPICKVFRMQLVIATAWNVDEIVPVYAAGPDLIDSKRYIRSKNREHFFYSRIFSPYSSIMYTSSTF